MGRTFSRNVITLALLILPLSPQCAASCALHHYHRCLHSKPWSVSPLEEIQALMVRIALAACLILLIGFAQEESIGAQDVKSLHAGVVRVSSARPGTGFIIHLESDAAYILTAAHVVAGNPNPKVEFFTNKHVLVPAEILPGAEGGDEMRGLALLVVRGKENLPTGVTMLPLDGTRRFSAGDEIIVVGFPRSAGPWHVIKGNIGSSQANDIFFSPSVDTGNSGGPIIRQNHPAAALQPIGSRPTLAALRSR